MGTAEATQEMIGGIVTTGSISSTVELDYNRGTAHKTYEPPAWVRALYRMAFQAPFPYTSNHAALEAARQRRRITGLLTKSWFSEDLVSPVLDIHDEDEYRHGFVTRLVRGGAPSDKKRARGFLKKLTRRFLQAGLPTWQVTPYNPRAVGNLIEEEDGTYRIIDLESNLVAPLFPVSGVVGAIRQGNFPAFDDIDGAQLDAYLKDHADELNETLGIAEHRALREAAQAYADAAQEWHSGEARLLSRGLKLLLKLVDVPSWIRSLRRMSDGGQAKAETFVRSGIDTWVEEGHLTDPEAARLRQALTTPEVTAVMAHLGAHVAMSVPLRFPVGSVARAGWTVTMRIKAEWAALRKKEDPQAARQVHTLAVAIAGLVPGFGAGAYLLAKPLRTNRALVLAATDRLLRKLPLRLHATFHLSALTTWYAKPKRPRTRSRLATVSQAAAGIRQNIADLAGHPLLLGGVLAVNTALLVAGSVLYFGFDSAEVFVEGGLMNTLGSAELVLAGAFGLLAFVFFWRGASRHASAGEAAGIFFWGVSGVGLLALAGDDFFGVHEQAGAWIADNAGTLPLFTNNVDDIITLGFGIAGLSLLYMFKQELFERRHSSVLLLAGIAAAGLMVAVDLYGMGGVRGLEFPAQLSAVGLLLLAYVMRYREVRAEIAVPSCALS